MRHGYTLVEVMVGLVIGMFVVAATFAFAGEQASLLDFTDDRVGMQQEGRAVMDLLTSDLRLAGLGVGYGQDGSFQGLRRGEFTVDGGARFSSDGLVLTGPSGDVATDDLGLRFANGDVRTIASYGVGQGQLCAGGRFRAGDLVLLVSKDSRHAQTVEIDSVGPDGCRDGTCLQGCESFTFTEAPNYQSSMDATTVPYEGGEAFGGFEEVVYFVAFDSDLQTRTLRRAQFGLGETCSTRDDSCGVRMARGVDSLQVRVWLLNQISQVWEDVTALPAIEESAPVRVDLELVLRGQSNMHTATHPAVRLELDNDACIPGPCGSPPDHHFREVLRTTVELRNAGRMRIR